MKNKRKIFADIYDKYIKKIYRFIFLKVNSKDIAEDLCSETFLRGWTQFEKKEIKNLSAFLYQIARNLIIDHYRAKTRNKTVSVENIQISDPLNIEEKAMLSSDIKVVRAKLANLKNDHQDLIIWRYIDEMSVSEIAKMLNKQEGTVRVGIHRALNSLKKTLEA